jgi:AraC family transcriptional regulator, positive regulator of tynA and feaB
LRDPAGRQASCDRADASAGCGRLRTELSQGFPFVLFDVPSESDGDVVVRKIGAHAIAHLRTARWSAEANAVHADALGFGEVIKVVWQLAGAMTYEDKEKAFSINTGELFLMRPSANHFLNVTTDYEAVVLTFNAGAHPAWLNLVDRGENRLVMKPSSAAVASAAGMLALARHPHADSSSERVLHSLFELATGSISHGLTEPPSEQIAPSLLRAHWLVREHMGDLSYTPARLAHDLGMSLRSLYNRFAGHGMTPAAFIRTIRLEQAKREIEGDPTGKCTLTMVALRNSFADSSSLCRAIKKRYGMTPRELRKSRSVGF